MGEGLYSAQSFRGEGRRYDLNTCGQAHLIDPSVGPSQAAICRELAEEEAHNIAIGNDLSLHDQVTPSVLISAGLDLEADQ